MKNPALARSFSALFAGCLFGIGLTVSGMTDTSKVIGFLDLFGDWKPDLAFVMIGALFITSIGYWFIFKREQPIFESTFYLPLTKVIDRELIIGAILFGVGWGLYGYCPGPALAAIAYLNPNTLIFVVTMWIGMFLAQFFTQRS